MRRINVVHDDDDIIVADKPAGLLTIGTDRERHRTLYRQLFDSERRRRRGTLGQRRPCVGIRPRRIGAPDRQRVAG